MNSLKKISILLFSLFSLYTHTQQIGTGFEGTPLLGLQNNLDESFVEQEGILKKAGVSWRTIINKCEGNLGLMTLPHPLIKSRCCYLEASDLGIQVNPLFTSGGSQGFSSLTEVRSIGAQSNNAMFSFAVAQFQKTKNKPTSRLVTCFPVAYENTVNISPNDYFTLFALMKQYANAHPEWMLEYYYLEAKVRSEISVCEIFEKNGDVNGDGKTSSLDLIKLTSSYVKQNIYKKEYDFNNDSKLNGSDVNLLRDYILNKLDCSKK